MWIEFKIDKTWNNSCMKDIEQDFLCLETNEVENPEGFVYALY